MKRQTRNTRAVLWCEYNQISFREPIDCLSSWTQPHFEELNVLSDISHPFKFVFNGLVKLPN